MESSALIIATVCGLCGCSLGLPLSAAVAPDVGVGVGPREEAHLQGGISADLLPQGHQSIIVGTDLGARASSKTQRVNPRYGAHIGVAHLPLRYEGSAGFVATLRAYGQTDAYESTGQGFGFSARNQRARRATRASRGAAQHWYCALHSLVGSRRAMSSARWFVSLGVIAVTGCTAFVGMPPASRPPPGSTMAPAPAAFLRSGTARVDITPPPGVSTFGHGPDARVSDGYWTRLYCRVFALETSTVEPPAGPVATPAPVPGTASAVAPECSSDESGTVLAGGPPSECAATRSTVRRFAIVPCDLAAVSGVLQRSHTCRDALVGVSVDHGACDHPTTSFSSAPRWPDDAACQGVKAVPGGTFQHAFAGGVDAFPPKLPLAVARLGDSLVTFVPAELTFSAGRQVANAAQTSYLEARPGTPAGVVGHSFIAGLANEYIMYGTTRAEYGWREVGGGCPVRDTLCRQTYEGSATLYGPSTVDLLEDRAKRVASALKSRLS